MHRRRPHACGATTVALALLVLASFVAARAATASEDRFVDDKVEITADVIDYDEVQKLFVAEGNVRIATLGGERSVEADWAAFSDLTRRAVASGHVFLDDEDERIRADFALVDLDTVRGYLYEGSYEAFDDARGTGIRMWGRELVKYGDSEYEMWRAAFTTCRCPDEDSREPWRIRASHADVEIGGYGVARNATFEILDVPVLYFPWLMFPVKTERETGLLLPEVAFGSRNGFEVGLPVFFAIGDPVNLTLTPSWMSKRGFKGDAELEVVWGERSWLRAFGAFLRDQEIEDEHDDARNDDDPYSVPPPFDEDRWAAVVEGQAYFSAPQPWMLSSDVKLISDNDYPTDFEELREARRDRFLESTVFATHHAPRLLPLGSVLSVQLADDLQSPDDKDRDNFVQQRLPTLTVSWLTDPVAEDALPFDLAVDFEYTDFERDGDPSDDVGQDAVLVDEVFYDTGIDATADSREGVNSRQGDIGRPPVPDPNGDNFVPGVQRGPDGDGQFQEGEPLGDRGHRVRLHPRVSRTWHLGRFDLRPEVGYAQTVYWTQRQKYEERGLTHAQVDLMTRLARRFGEAPAGSDASAISWWHRIEPQLTWLWIDPRSQSGDPIFVPRTELAQQRLRQLSPESLSRDPADRISPRNALLLGASQRLYRRSESGPRLVLDLAASAAWELEDRKAGQWVVDGTWHAPWNVDTRFNLAVDPDDLEIDEGLAQLTWTVPTGGQVGVRYRYLRQIPRFFESFRGTNRDRFEDFSGSFDRVSQIDLRLRLNLGPYFIVGGNITYDVEDTLRLDSRANLDYVSRCRCWALGLEVSDDRNRGTQFGLRYTFIGLGQDPANPFRGANPFGVESGLQ